MKLQLSLSTKIVENKESALKIIKFGVADIDIDQTYLKKIFTQNVYSGNQWDKGLCKNVNFQRMSAIILDADQGLKITEAQDLFKQYHHIIHTSTSHLADLKNKGGKQERFRIILPLDPNKYNTIDSSSVANEVYLYLFNKYIWADASCKDAARKYFPFLNKTYPDLFILHINEGKEYFSVDLTEVMAQAKAMVVAPAKTQIDNTSYIYLNDEFVLRDGQTKIRLRDINNYTSVYCNFCDDINSASGSAFIDLNADGKHYLHCKHCNRSYWIAPEDEKGELFYLGHQLMKIVSNPQKVAITPITKELLNDMQSERRQILLNRVAKFRTMPAGSFAVNHMSDAFAETISYELNTKHWELNIKTPPIPVVKKDNTYIDTWLDEMFKTYSDFVKDWMALFCYTNYKPLPAIVLNGIRSSGKTTFGELIKDIFPNMGAQWQATGEDFTEYFQKKLLLVEENPESDKRDQYVNIKKVSGSDTLNVNVKYGAKFEVRKNANIIVLSNAARPLVVIANEKPAHERDNQFFMLTLTERPKNLNSKIKVELRERVGYYVRTELRTRFLKWQASGIESQNRYSLPCPITDNMLYVYESSKTAIDEECEDIYDILKNGRPTYDNIGNPLREYGPYQYISFSELKDICNAFKYKQTPSTYKKHLQDLNLIEKVETRSAGSRIGYKVI
jgi:hypothetical protein